MPTTLATPPARSWPGAPGRVNLIGDHTDYNDGFVLPMIIDRHVEMVARRRPDRQVQIVAAESGARVDNTLGEPIDYSSPNWLPYVLGVVHELAQRGRLSSGIDIVFRGTVPRGAGLSSSAALEVATALALDTVFNLWLNPVDMARLCRDVEHRYAGVRCGIMDQFTSRLGRSDHALLIDCRSLEARHVPMSLDGHRLVIVDTGDRRELADSAYNQRRTECEEAVALLREEETSITSLRDVTPGMLSAHENRLPPDLFARCRHVVSENHRVIEACERLSTGDLPAFGRLMNASHLSLRNDFEVSHPALDRLVWRRPIESTECSAPALPAPASEAAPSTSWPRQLCRNSSNNSSRWSMTGRSSPLWSAPPSRRG